MLTIEEKALHLPHERLHAGMDGPSRAGIFEGHHGGRVHRTHEPVDGGVWDLPDVNVLKTDDIPVGHNVFWNKQVHQLRKLLGAR